MLVYSQSMSISRNKSMKSEGSKATRRVVLKSYERSKGLNWASEFVSLLNGDRSVYSRRVASTRKVLR